MQVVPAIIPHTKEQLEEQIKKVAKFANLVQIDITDGVFVPTKTWPYNGRDAEYFENLKTEEIGWPRWEDVEFEIHLMIKNPEESVSDWIHTGAGIIVAHIEATDNFQKVIDICKENSVSIGIAIKPSTDISRLLPFVSQVDFIQVMGNDLLGKHGVELDDKAVDKIKALREKYLQSIIAIDIGVNEETAEDLVSAGANKLISGSAILESENPEEVYRELEAIS
ncbi:MAG: hypothetical protein ABL899_03050 [Nitrospira sp.]